MMTPAQALRFVREATGTRIRLTLGDEVVGWKFTEDRLTLIVSTARCHVGSRAIKVTHRGTVGYGWRVSPDGRWVADPPLRVESRLPEPEYWTSVTPRDPARQREVDEWARLCYRPGTSSQPMDGPGGSNPSVR
jgi:hypothetical protein